MVSKLVKKAIICYLSFSGNTEEIAELIQRYLRDYDIDSDLYEIGFGLTPDLSQYKYKFFGSFTWGVGSTPDDMKDFVAELGYKPSNVVIFGSGDTQFGGDELFCRATDRLAEFYNSPVRPLKIEQSPRGSQEILVEEWVNKVLKSIK